jgi:hypothetical protein
MKQAAMKYYASTSSQFADSCHPEDGGDTSVLTRATRCNVTEDDFPNILYKPGAFRDIS